MEINTKYSIGDIVYVKPGHEIVKCNVVGIRISVSIGSGTRISYNIKGINSCFSFWLPETDLFSNEDELKKPLNL